MSRHVDGFINANKRTLVFAPFAMVAGIIVIVVWLLSLIVVPRAMGGRERYMSHRNGYGNDTDAALDQVGIDPTLVAMLAMNMGWTDSSSRACFETLMIACISDGVFSLDDNGNTLRVDRGGYQQLSGSEQKFAQIIVHVMDGDEISLKLLRKRLRKGESSIFVESLERNIDKKAGKYLTRKFTRIIYIVACDYLLRMRFPMF